MMNLYPAITRTHIESIREGRVRIDPHLSDMESDRRMGLSLVAPVSGLSAAYARLAERFRRCEPGQYLYPEEDLHVTLFDFLPASETHMPDSRLEGAIAEFCGDLLARTGIPSRIGFAGVAFSDEAGILCGDCPGIPSIRDRIRDGLSGLGLANRERYRSMTSHATFMRFKASLSEPRRLAELITAAADEPIGEAVIASFDLVRHDWYNLSGKRKILASFTAGK